MIFPFDFILMKLHSLTLTSTLPKPHEPTLQTKLCQRACKANAKEKLFKKNSQTFKKIKNTATQADTDRQESKMTMTRKLNIDNGLQGRRTEHQAVTKAICNKGISGNSIFLPRSNFGIGGQESSP